MLKIEVCWYVIKELIYVDVWVYTSIFTGS